VRELTGTLEGKRKGGRGGGGRGKMDKPIMLEERERADKSQ
jgi:hypothetical protein